MNKKLCLMLTAALLSVASSAGAENKPIVATISSKPSLEQLQPSTLFAAGITDDIDVATGTENGTAAPIRSGEFRTSAN